MPFCVSVVCVGGDLTTFAPRPGDIVEVKLPFGVGFLHRESVEQTNVPATSQDALNETLQELLRFDPYDFDSFGDLGASKIRATLQEVCV